jgi:hypothetical protein
MLFPGLEVILVQRRKEKYKESRKTITAGGTVCFCQPLSTWIRFVL